MSHYNRIGVMLAIGSFVQIGVFVYWFAAVYKECKQILVPKTYELHYMDGVAETRTFIVGPEDEPRVSINGENGAMRMSFRGDCTCAYPNTPIYGVIRVNKIESHE